MRFAAAAAASGSSPAATAAAYQASLDSGHEPQPSGLTSHSMACPG